MSIRFLRLLLCLLFFISSSSYHANAQKHAYFSAVSPEFPNGLHAKYVQYIASELKVPIHIQLIPFARRLRELDNGSLDILVGVSSLRKIGPNTILIHPEYESLGMSLFVNKGNPANIHSPDDIKNKAIAITRGSKISDVFPTLREADVIEVDTLEQKIAMVEKGRIDGFFHLKQATLKVLSDTNKTRSIILSPIEETHHYTLHVALNRHSSLFEHRHTLSQIIKTGVQRGDFEAIRKQHYDAIEENE
ncbi:transporter substrate-binding domain-containing protein [Aestuariibacter sp. AA17]|uniref:Transporter substrate-binding domain-containing protein n=1 Tax=Fluctibacter corallii TaxID=2984329 RepID=A0ABT3A456_9ALTE|nr:transporter substrate-binding domain-containing protein [Aestuariibacter sp. AA17]MCV2883378.1 transporter substrate-binding domain-containing protein [Aestuariibacter sp. AA17]